MPDLRELVADPARAVELTPDEAAAALIELATLQAALAARARSTPVASSVAAHESSPDRLLTPEQVAERFGRSVAWVYRQSKHWPFTRRITRKTLRFSESELARYLTAMRTGRRRA